MSKTKVKTRFGCSDAVLTLEKGSIFEFACSKEKTSINHITGGSLILEDGKRLIQVSDNKTSVTFDKLPGQLIPMSVRVLLPSNLAKQTQYSLSISQLDENRQLVGGAD